jgi:hypothetical protein
MEFPVSTLTAVTSIGSHYTPLLLDTGAGLPNRPNKFFFETNWFELQGFKAMVEDWWEQGRSWRSSHPDAPLEGHVQHPTLTHALILFVKRLSSESSDLHRLSP